MPDVNTSGVAPLQAVSVTLTSTQVLALHTTPVTVVGGQPGQALIPLWSVWDYVAGTTAYTDGGGNIQLFTPVAATWVAFASAGFWDQATSQGKSEVSSAAGFAIASISGAALRVQQATANPTLGNGTVTVTVLYAVVAVS